MSEKPQYPPLRSPMVVDGQLTDPWARYFQHVVTPYFERLLNLEDMEILDWSNNRQKDHERRLAEMEKLIQELWQTNDKGFTKRLEDLENSLQFIDGPKDATLLRRLDDLEALIFSVLMPHPQNTDIALGAIAIKNPPIDADKAIYRDSTASDALVTSTWLQIKAFLKTYFDTLYGALGLAHTRLHSIVNTLDHSSTATPGQILQANASGLPVDATNTDAAVAATVGAAHTQGSDTALGAVGMKDPPIDADRILYRDSTAADVLVTSTWTQIKAFLKTYFDTLYNLYVHPNHSGDVTSVADGAQTIANDAVTYAKMQNVSATDKILGRATAGAGDVEEIACTAAGRALFDDANAAAQLVTLGVPAAIAADKNPLAFAQGINMTAATSASNGIQVADNDNIDFGTGYFTLAWRGSIPDWTPAANVILVQKLIGGVGYQLEVVATTGIIRMTLNATVYNSSVAPTITDGTVGEIAAVVTVGAVNTTVDFYFNGVALGTQQTAANPGTVSSAAVLYVMGTSAVRSAGRVYFFYPFNRALTAAQVLSLYRNGIDFADKWGSQTNLVTGNIAQTNFPYNTLSDPTTSSFGAISNGTGLQAAGTPDSVVFVLDKKYLVDFTLTLNSGTAPIVYCLSDIDFSGGYATQQNSAAGRNQLVFIATASGTGLVAFGNSSTATNYAVAGLIIKQIGATLALEGEGMQPAPGQCLDSSSNKLHAKMPIAGASLVRSKRDFTVKWVNTWAGTHEAQYIGGINQAILPSNCYVQTIIGVIAGGFIEDIIVGDGSDTDHWVAITTGLAAGTTSFTIANPISDGVNYKMVVDPDANMTGSITWTIKGIVL